jgi:predicted ribosome quality control (RQC) complex YloA/Tae2 family protein
MTLDGLTLHEAVKEIREEITGCKVDKVHQPQPDTVVLALRAPGKNPRLLISAGAADSRMHLTAQKYENPKTPPMFCMFLRKHLTGAAVADVMQTGLERIVTISLETKDELGLPRRMALVAELMGKYSNVMLLDEKGVVMDSLRHVTEAQSRVRSVLPGLAYALPQSDKLNPLTVSHATLAEMLGQRRGKGMRGWLSQILQGVSSQTADELLYRYMPQGYAQRPHEEEKLAGVIGEFFSEPAQPTMYLRGGIPFFYASRAYGSVAADETERCENVNAMIDRFYFRLREIAELTHKRETLKRIAGRHLEKLGSLLEKQLFAVEQARQAEQMKAFGDLVTANIYRISRGQSALAAQDFVTGEDVAVPLDVRLSPAANAQRYYKKYNKLKSGMDMASARMRATQENVAFLESVLASLDVCETPEELAEVEYELSRAGFIKAAGTASARPTEKASAPHRFLSSDGFVIYAGKNNRQNDELTMHMAAQNDIWLHTKDIPGSHVLITGIKGSVPEQTLFEAAVIAATLSKAGASAKVAVDYAPRKNVRKPNGAKPGMVVYEGYNTALVTPDRALLERLLQKEAAKKGL